LQHDETQERDDLRDESGDLPGAGTGSTRASLSDGGVSGGGRERQPSTAIGPSDPPEPLMAGREEAALTEARGTIRAGRLAGKGMWPAIWILALPVLFQQFMAALVGLVDKLFAGSLPSEIVVPAMDAIGVGSFVGWFIGIAMAGLGVGAQAIIARSMGSGNREEAELALGQALTLSVFWGVLVAVAMWAMVTPLARMSGLSEEAVMHCREYVGLIALGMPACGLMMVGSMCLYGAGETVRPSLIAVGVNVVNVFFSWILSGIVVRAGEWSLPHPLPIDPAVWGVRGIALGTTIGYIAGAIATVLLLRRGVRDLILVKGTLRPRLAMGYRIARLGIPNFLEGMAMWAVNIFMMYFIGLVAIRQSDNGVGEGLVGAHIIAIQWEALSFLPGFAMGTAAGALAGQYLGAGNPAMARRAIMACTIVGMLLMGAAGASFMFLGEPLTRLISDHPVHLQHTPNLLLVVGSVQVFFALSMVTRQGLRGVGDVKWTLFITTFSSYAIRLPLAYFFGITLGLGLEGIWIGLSAEIIIRGLFFGARFLHSGWERVKV